jgi:D-3-phosphoglycerate dehydrogenase
MAFNAVLSISFPYTGIPHDEKAYRDKGIEFKKIPCNSEDEIIAAASDADAVLTVIQPFGRKIFENLTRLKLVHNIGIGYEGLDVEAATEHGVCVTTPTDYCLEEVSDHAMAQLLDCGRKISRLDTAVRAGQWDNAAKQEIRANIWPRTFRLRGQTLGLIGFGNIPRALVPKAKGFGMNIVVFDPFVSETVFEEYGVASVDLDYLLRASDVISLHAALTPETKGMFGSEAFGKMKPTAYVINTARGQLVDEQALYTALLEGQIAGAGLDVMETESVPSDHPMLQLDNVIVTAHSAHYSDFSAAELRRRPFEEMSRVIDKRWPQRLLNPQVKGRYVEKWGEMSET